MKHAVVAQRNNLDIQYHPEFAKYQHRTRRRKDTETLQMRLPAEFPAQLVSPLVWGRKEIES
ncbi:hypothetical protein N7448_007850 [Penicillium atrosanguineum]|uniref:uncharacterized protein n=1 Tax=Penicillium atrosanguineum TaxID=1132637 RepID=UPI00239BB7D4|nr:uncharacterized protein N7443_001129 [Penicillium atrosanguineum]KAJ5127071.1 hypothetical protein N7448_007850 [Penicillium atrosanguineum]KAJ5314245.1 hypothetical protein N7443_001129 [Penicillium atrosanguineum]